MLKKINNFRLIILTSLTYIIQSESHISELSASRLSSHNSNINSDVSDPLLEPIEGTKNYRMTGKKGKEDKTWFDGRESNYVYCLRPAKCVTLKNVTCLGSNLPYTNISFSLTDAYNYRETMDKLNAFQALRHIPKCWAVIQVCEYITYFYFFFVF